MIKNIFKIIITVSIIIILCIFYLSYFGINTSKFNSLIIDQIKNQNSKLDIDLKKIKLHLDLKNISIKIKTQNPTLIINKSKSIDLEEISSNISIKSYFQNKFAIKNLSIRSKNNDIKDFIEFYRVSTNTPQIILLNQIIKKGNIKIKANLNFDQSGKVNKDYKISGNVANTEFGLIKFKNIKGISFNFKITDKNYDLKNILFNLNKTTFNSDFINIQKKDKNFFVEGNLKNKNDNVDEDFLSFFFKNNLNNFDFSNSKFDSLSKFSFNLSKKFKVKNLIINSDVNINELTFNHKIEKLKNYINGYENKVKLNENKLKIKYENKKIILNGSSELYIAENEKNTIDFKILKNKDNILFETILNLSKVDLIIDEISYIKKSKQKAILKVKGLNKENYLILKSIIYSENKNRIKIENLKIENSKISNLDKIEFNYLTENNFKNALYLKRNNNDYELIGKSYDAEKLIAIISDSDTNKNFLDIFNDLNSKIKITIQNVMLDDKNEIYNLYGNLHIQNNKIFNLDISSKFSDKEKIYLKIKSENDKKTITNFYSDRAKPFVKKYKFIKGFEEGNIVFNSTKIDNVSNSRLIIDNFKVKKIPVLAKLLTLASLQGIADLLTGEGIRFSDFEMTYSNKGNLMTIDEIYAIGPAISILMEGYVESKKLISLRGTLVPATTINRTIASIPLVGDILIGKKVGEGVFGVSFKIKGPPKDLKTKVNPIKTLTPRFITRTLEKIKKN